MSTQTPRRLLDPPRPHLLKKSTINTSSSPNLAASYTGQRPPLASPQPSSLSASIALARKASLNQLTSGALATVPDGSVEYSLESLREAETKAAVMPPITPAMSRVHSDGSGHGDIALGDLVDVPGGMHGTVKFIGSVKGKNGTFAGVELSKEWAARGKNDGDVEGFVFPHPYVQYTRAATATTRNL